MKKVLALMLALCMVFLMAACAGTTKTDSTTAPADNAETNTESTEKKTIAFLPPAMISPYYASCINGAKPQAEALGYELLVSAPDSESDYASQVQLVEDMIAAALTASSSVPSIPTPSSPLSRRPTRPGSPSSCLTFRTSWPTARSTAMSPMTSVRAAQRSPITWPRS